jgi:hypothetical protein
VLGTDDDLLPGGSGRYISVAKRVTCIAYHAVIHSVIGGEGLMPIVNFKDRRLQQVFNRGRPKGFPSDLVSVTRRKLVMLDAATVRDSTRSA